MSLRTIVVAGLSLTALADTAAACETAEFQGVDRLRLTRPADGAVVSGFGMRVHPLLQLQRFHSGIDIAGSRGDPVRAAGRGVAETGPKGEYGNYVRIDHGNGVATAYGHMNAIAVREGDCVADGTVIGYVGSTGLSSESQLHFEVIVQGRHVDPAPVIGVAAQ